MAQDNFLFQLDNENHQIKRQSVSVYFDNKSENLLVPDWQNKKRKYRRTTLIEENCNNTASWQIDS